MKNKVIIDAFNKINCSSKEEIYQRVISKNRFKYKLIPVLGVFILIFILFPKQEAPTDTITPLNTPEIEFKINNCESEDPEECEERND